MNHYDLVIVGGSLAGASLANRLAGLGRRVLLIDSARFPRTKVCGEGLSHVGLALLDELSIPWRSAVKHTTFSSLSLTVAAGESEQYRKSIKLGQYGGMGVLRSELDNCLLGRATSHCEVRQGVSVSSLSIRRDDVSFILSNGEGICSDLLVIADGAESATCRLAGIPLAIDRRTRFAISGHFYGTFLREFDEVSILKAADYELYCTPITPTLLNISALVRHGAARRGQQEWGFLWSRGLKLAGFVGELVAEPRGVPRVGELRRAYGINRVVLLGDARESFDPLAGMGMTHALYSAKSCAHALAQYWSGAEQSPVYLLERYRETLSAGARNLRWYSRLLSAALRSPANKPLLGFAARSGIVAFLNRYLARL